MTHLTVGGVDLSFGQTAVLAGASLTVDLGEVVAVLGPSGSGKSTLLRVIAGIAVPDTGTVTLGGHDITNVPTHQRGVGMVFQDNQLFPHLTVGDNVAFGLKLAGIPPAVRRTTAGDWLARVGLDGFGSRDVGALSGGEAKRVALARTLAVEPTVVLLDEPLTGLDRELHDRLAHDVAALLADLAITAILVTHDPDEAATIAVRSLHMDDING
jgi:thiamine transport system ATP-binding protein